MASTPFDDPPRSLFLRRMTGLCAAVLAICAFGLGGSGLYSKWIVQVTDAPQVCWARTAANEFQVRQCDLYWKEIQLGGVLILAPFGVAILSYFLARRRFLAVYRRAQKMSEGRKAAFKGVVTDPPEAPTDFFSWFYCFRPVMVELENKSQIKVYFSAETPCPPPGQTISMGEPITEFGAPRYFGKVYAPHIAVVRGV